MLAALLVVLGGAPAVIDFAQGATPWSTGDVVVGFYQHIHSYAPTGVDHGSYDLGSTVSVYDLNFDSNGALFAVQGKSASSDVTKYGSTLAPTGVFASYASGGTLSIAFDASGGHAYVGRSGGVIDKYDAAGTLQASFAAASEVPSGATYLDVASDQCTVHYTSAGGASVGGNLVKRYDVCASAQLADFASVHASGDPCLSSRACVPFDIILLPGGSALVEDTHDVHLLSPAGQTTRAFDAAGEDQWYGIALSEKGATFWAAGQDTRRVYEFDLATGTVLRSFSTGALYPTEVAVVGASRPSTPPVVTSVQPSSQTPGAALKVDWSAPATGGPFSTYYLYRTTTPGTYADAPRDVGNVLTFTDTSLAWGSQYCYEVSAANSAGESPRSPEVCATTPIAPGTTPNTCIQWPAPGDCLWWSWVQVNVTGRDYVVTPLANPDGTPDSSCSSSATRDVLGYVSSVHVDCFRNSSAYTYTNCASPPCHAVCYDPTINLQIKGVPSVVQSPYGASSISAKCESPPSASTGISCLNHGAPGLGNCSCSDGTTCTAAQSDSCNVGTGGISCVPGTAACQDDGQRVSCKGTDALYVRDVTHLYCDTSVQYPESVDQTGGGAAPGWIATCSGVDP